MCGLLTSAQKGRKKGHMKVVRISLRDVPELDDDDGTPPRPPPYPPPPVVAEQDRIADEVERILQRRSHRAQEEGFVRKLSGDARTPMRYSTQPLSSTRSSQRVLGRISSFSSRAHFTAEQDEYGPASEQAVELKATRLWNDLVQSAEKRKW
jgi:hypothetical protein